MLRPPPLTDLPADEHVPFELFPQVSSVESDRYCEGCGYNLHGQFVRREPRTEILLTRCPECGRFEPVIGVSSIGRIWMRRLAISLLGGWIAGVILLLIGLTVVQVGIDIAVLDELTHYQLSGSSYILVVRHQYDDAPQVVAGGAVGAFGLGFVSAGLLVVVMPHWRRIAQLGFVIGQALLSLTVAYGIWSFQAPDLAGWAAPILMLNVGLRFAGGLLGLYTGRGLARGLVRAVLPPRFRPPLSFLWTADELPPPRPPASTTSAA